MEVEIKQELLENILEASRNTHPYEFIALLSGTPLSEYILLPSTYGKSFSSIRLDLLPLLEKPQASFHSHPSFSSQPSKADLSFFSLFQINIIASQPYTKDSISFYNSKGIKIPFKILQSNLHK